MSNNYGETIAQSIDMVITERLKSLSFDTTLTCTITDDSQAESGTYTVTNGILTFTAYSSDTGYKEGEQIYVSIPNNDYSEQKIITGKKKVGEAETPYVYKQPFASLVKATDNLCKNSNEIGLIANGEVESIEVCNNVDLPQTKIPYTRLGIKADFKSLLPSTVTQGNYGLEIQLTTDKGNTITEKLDIIKMYGDPYQFFTYINQEVVFEIENIKAIKGIKLNFFQDKKFSELKKDTDTSFDWIDDKKDLEKDLFVSNIEVYLGYDVAELADDKYTIFVVNKNISEIDETQLSYNKNNEDLNRVIQGQWIHAIEEGDSLILSPNSTLDSMALYKSLQMIVWGEGDSQRGIKWYRKSSGAPSPDDYAGSGWIAVDIDPSKGNPFQEEFILNKEFLEDSFKSILFDNLKLDKQIKDDKEDIIITSAIPVESNILTFYNSDYSSFSDTNRRTQLSIEPTDNSNGNYYIYQLDGTLNERIKSNETRELKLYFDDLEVKPDSNYKIEWIVPCSNTMLTNFAVNGVKIDEVKNNENLNSFVKVVGLKEDRTEINSDTTPTSTAVFKKIIIDYSAKGSSQTTLSYKIISNYYPEKANNIIDCSLYRPIRDSQGQLDGNFEQAPFTSSRKFNFGLESTSGTEIVFYLDSDKTPFVKLEQDGEQSFNITPHAIVSATGEVVDFSKLAITYSWLENDCKNANITTNTDKSAKVTFPKRITEDKYAVLQATTQYGDVKNVTAYLSFAFGDSWNGKDYAELPDGAFEVIYDSASGLPFEKKVPVSYNIDNLPKDVSVTWKIQKRTSSGWADIDDDKESQYYPSITTTKKLLPAPLYTDGLDRVSVKAIGKTANNSTVVCWSQPLLILKNRFPCAIINQWDGKLKIDENNNSIASAMMVAGEKNENNEFSGVIMGKPVGDVEEFLNKTGLYGYSEGEQSFGFRADGTAFIGKNGKGRIAFDGNKGVIESGGFDKDVTGMRIDLDGDNKVPPFIKLQDYENKKEKFSTIIQPDSLTIHRGGQTVSGELEDRESQDVSFYIEIEKPDSSQQFTSTVVIKKYDEEEILDTISLDTLVGNFLRTPEFNVVYSSANYIQLKYSVFTDEGADQVKNIDIGSLDSNTSELKIVLFLQDEDEQYQEGSIRFNTSTTSLDVPSDGIILDFIYRLDNETATSTVIVSTNQGSDSYTITKINKDNYKYDISELSLLDCDNEKLLIPRLNINDGIYFEPKSYLLYNADFYEVSSNYLLDKYKIEDYLNNMVVDQTEDMLYALCALIFPGGDPVFSDNYKDFEQWLKENLSDVSPKKAKDSFLINAYNTWVANDNTLPKQFQIKGEKMATIEDDYDMTNNPNFYWWYIYQYKNHTYLLPTQTFMSYFNDYVEGDETEEEKKKIAQKEKIKNGFKQLGYWYETLDQNIKNNLIYKKLKVRYNINSSNEFQYLDSILDSNIIIEQNDGTNLPEEPKEKDYDTTINYIIALLWYQLRIINFSTAAIGFNPITINLDSLDCVLADDLKKYIPTEEVGFESESTMDFNNETTVSFSANSEQLQELASNTEIKFQVVSSTDFVNSKKTLCLQRKEVKK